MDPSRIAALLEPFLEAPLSEPQLEQISTYIDLLLRWNARINLTAIRDPEQIVPRHFGESLFLARHVLPPTGGHRSLATDHRPTTTVLDLGSGAGFPALPIKIWEPSIHLTMVEANHKKAAFLREAARALKLMNVDVIAARAESLRKSAAIAKSSKHSEKSPEQAAPEVLSRRPDVVTFRAVEKFDQILQTAASFLGPTSQIAILITEAQQSTLELFPNVEWQLTHIPQSHSRKLAIAIKVA